LPPEIEWRTAKFLFEGAREKCAASADPQRGRNRDGRTPSSREYGQLARHIPGESQKGSFRASAKCFGEKMRHGRSAISEMIRAKRA